MEDAVYGPKITSQHKTFIQRKEDPTPKPKDVLQLEKGHPRQLKHSTFFITINTNSTFKGEHPDCAAQRLADVIDGLSGQSCALWGTFLVVPQSPAGKTTFDYYQNDDKQGNKHWCELMESFHILTAGTEWAPGTKTGKNQYLHVHMVVEISHRTRLRVNGLALGKYIRDKMGLGHVPYVHINGFSDKTKNLLQYVMKNAWLGKSDPLKELVQGMYNLKC